MVQSKSSEQSSCDRHWEGEDEGNWLSDGMHEGDADGRTLMLGGDELSWAGLILTEGVFDDRVEGLELIVGKTDGFEDGNTLRLGLDEGESLGPVEVVGSALG